MWGKKDKNCDAADPEDQERGSFWDHVIFDPETKLVVTLVVGRRTKETLSVAFTDFFARTDGALPALITTDEYAPYKTVILETYGVWAEQLGLSPPERREWDEAGMREFHFPVEVTYATVHKEREAGRVVSVEQRLVLGSEEGLEEALEDGAGSGAVNTSYVERWNGTQRHFNARKGRKVCTFSKDLSCHVAVTWLCVLWYNFGWCVRALRVKVQDDPPRYERRTPAMAAGLAGEAWDMGRLMAYPLYPGRPPTLVVKDKDGAESSCPGPEPQVEGG